jgi:hypothetical protein
MSESVLTHEHEWPADSRECVFLGRAASQLSDNELLWSRQRSGRLSARVYRVGRTDFGPIDLPATVFLNTDREQVLTTWQIEVRETDQRRPAAIRRVIPVPHWLYVKRTSLNKFMKARPGATGTAEGRPAKLQQTRITITKEQRVKRASQAIWGTGGPPDHMTPKAMAKAVNDHFTKIGEPLNVSDKHIIRNVRK